MRADDRNAAPDLTNGKIAVASQAMDNLVASGIAARRAAINGGRSVYGDLKKRLADIPLPLQDPGFAAEQLAKQAESKGSYEEKLEPILTFLANSYNLWETSEIALPRTVLKLAFADRLQYNRNESARTTEITMLFKALGGAKTYNVCFGAGGGRRIIYFQKRVILHRA